MSCRISWRPVPELRALHRLETTPVERPRVRSLSLSTDEGWVRLSSDEKAAFALLAEEVFALDTAIQWFALERAGREPRCARRDAETGRVFEAATTSGTELVDPLLLLLAEGRASLYGQEECRNPRGLLFVVLV